MKRSGQCPKCGGRDIRRYQPSNGMPLIDKGWAVAPSAWGIAYTCVGCGFMEFWAEGERFHPPKP